jgi:hypothetical protein
MKKGTFETPLRMEDTSDGDHFLVYEPLIYVSCKGERYTVPAGFVTDLNSVPWLFRRLIPKSTNTNRAAVLHDFLYAIGHSKAEADYLYGEAIDACNAHPVKRWILFQSVDKFGGSAWKKHAKAREQKAGT